MRRGEIRVVDFRGWEASKRRPAVIVSNDRECRGRPYWARCNHRPSNHLQLWRIYPFQVRLPAAASGLRQDSKVQAEQVRSVAVERLGERVGNVPTAIMLQIDEALRLHLAL